MNDAPQIVRLPPHSLEAEDALLGSVIIDPDCIVDLDFLQPSMFYRQTNGWVFEAFRTLFEKHMPIDFVTVCETLRAIPTPNSDRLDELGGEGKIVGFINNVPTALNAVHYAGLIKDTYMRRQLLLAASQLANSVYDGETVNHALGIGQAALGEVIRQSESRRLIDAHDLMALTLLQYEKAKEFDGALTGVTTGYSDLDRLLGGLQKSDLIIVGARPGMGKTSFVNGVRLNASAAAKRVLSFDMEMRAAQNGLRMLSADARLDAKAVRDGQLGQLEEAKLLQSAGELSMRKLWIDDSPSHTIDSLRTRATRAYYEHGIELIIVDYLQLISAGARNRNRQEEVSEVGRSLKQLARELDIPIVATAQLSRNVEQRQNKRPNLADLRESGSLEQEADVVMFLYRDEYYNPETTERPNILEVNVAKHRNGPTGEIDLYWHAKAMAARNLQRMQLNLGKPAPWANKAAYDADQMDI